jgi:nitrite reductase/ring-hydroxylating ferredoxin subunit
MRKETIASWADLAPGGLAGALVADVDPVIVKWPDGIGHSVLYGRCVHRGALLADGAVVGKDLVCGVHNWDYRYETGVSGYNAAEKLHKFASGLDGDDVWVDADEVEAWAVKNSPPFDRSAYQGAFQDPHGTPHEPHVKEIRELASNGLDGVGHHGPMGAMGVPHSELPAWHDIQLVTAQLAAMPLLDDEDVSTGIVIGPNAAKPLHLDIPLFVSDMSFGALSQEAKTALARGGGASGLGNLFRRRRHAPGGTG